MTKWTKPIQVLIEKIYVKVLRLQHIPHSEAGLLYAHIKTYKGPDVTVNGSTITKGDQVVEFHIDNFNIQQIDGSIKSVIKGFQREMLYLTEAIDTIKAYEGIKGAYAVSVLHPLLRLLGFTPFPLKNKLLAAYLRFWENMLRKSFGAGKNTSKKKRDPMICWITTDKMREQSLKAER